MEGGWPADSPENPSGHLGAKTNWGAQFLTAGAWRLEPIHHHKEPQSGQDPRGPKLTLVPSREFPRQAVMA